MSAAEDLQIQAERLRSSGALGRSAPIQKLFDYLLQRSLEGDAPKEIEVAEAVFGRRVGFDVSLDSTVRVYVHRLRRKLDEYYAGPGRDEPVRLAIPKGEYRLVAAPRDEASAEPGVARAPPRRWLALAAASLLALNILILGGWWASSQFGGYAFARGAPAWSALLKGERPISLIVGDYYIFGELDEHRDVSRLIREYKINSAEDLSNFQMENPEFVDRYTDLDLFYLPTSAAPALRSLMPILAPTSKARDRVRVVTASHLTPDLLKRTEIVYVGYLSGLGVLRRQVFAGSRFRIGDTYDELVDTTNNQIYWSQEGGPNASGETRRDYGYFSTFVGPEGNRMVIIAGTRDVAVMQMAETLSSREGLAELTRRAKGMEAFEALYEVDGMDRVNLRGRLLLVSPINAAKAGAGAPPSPYPN